MSVGDKARSAGEHEWSEIILRIRPGHRRLGLAVYTRRNRGTALVWERRLGSLDVAGPEPGPTSSVADCLRACSLALLHVADRLDG